MKKKSRKCLYGEWIATHPVVVIVASTCLLLLTFLLDFLSIGWKYSAIRYLMIFAGTLIVGSTTFTLQCVFINCLSIDQEPQINETALIVDADKNILMITLKKMYYTVYSFIKPRYRSCLTISLILVISPVVIDLGLYGWGDSAFRMIVYISNGILIIPIALSIMASILKIPINYINCKLKDKKERG